MSKLNLPVDKIQEAFVTNDGWLINQFASQPLQRKKELNMIGG